MEDYKEIHINNLRKIIGFVGLSLPFVLLAYTLLYADCNKVLNSISAYYHTRSGHIFSAFTLVIGVILFNTIKYDDDKWFYRIAAVLAIIIGFVPNFQDKTDDSCFIRLNTNEVLDNIHLAAAITFFSLLSYLAYFRFTKTDPLESEIKLEKLKRNRIYRWCGIIMMAIMVGLLISWRLEPHILTKFRPLFVGEAAMLIVFSYAWLIKGQQWFKDKKDHITDP